MLHIVNIYSNSNLINLKSPQLNYFKLKFVFEIYVTVFGHTGFIQNLKTKQKLLSSPT